MFSGIPNRKLGPDQRLGSLDTGAHQQNATHTRLEEEKATDEEDNEGGSITLPADVAAVFPAELGYYYMDGDSPNNTAMEVDVPITQELDTDMIATETSELG